MSTFHVFIRPNGNIEFIYDDLLRPLLHQGACQTKRASHVESPDGGLTWWANMSPTGVNVKLGPFPSKEVAVREEVNFLVGEMRKGQLNIQ